MYVSKLKLSEVQVHLLFTKSFAFPSTSVEVAVAVSHKDHDMVVLFSVFFNLGSRVGLN